MTDNTTEGENVKELRERVNRLENVVKEREINFFRSLKTLSEDLYAYHKGEKKDFPTPALLGAIFAFLRRRWVWALGGVVGVIIAGVQVWILISQNQIIAQQTEANQMEAVTTLLLALEKNDGKPNEIALALLQVYGVQGFEVLMELGNNPGELGYVVRDLLSDGAANHTPEQAALVFALLLVKYEQNLTHLANENPTALIDVFGNRELPMHALPELRDGSFMRNYVGQREKEWNFRMSGGPPSLSDEFFASFSRVYSVVGRRSLEMTIGYIYGAWVEARQRSIEVSGNDPDSDRTPPADLVLSLLCGKITGQAPYPTIWRLMQKADFKFPMRFVHEEWDTNLTIQRAIARQYCAPPDWIPDGM